MIDIHSHILVDSKKDPIQSKILLKKIIQKNFTDIVAILEYDSTLSEVKNISNYQSGVDILERSIYEEEESINLFFGSEVSIREPIIQLLHDNVIHPINNSSYLFIKYDSSVPKITLLFKVSELRKIGIQPIITDIEKQGFLQFRKIPITELIQLGAFIHIDFDSLLGNNGKEIFFRSLKLLRNRLVDMVGSNIQHENQLILNQEYSLEQGLQNILGKEEFERLLVENPRHILNDEKIKRQVLIKK